MAGDAKLIKNKIQATQNTAQITKAMNMVSASKLKQAELAIRHYYGFLEKIESIVRNLVSSGDVEHPLFIPRNGSRTCYIIITSERGLAGPFNNNIYKLLDSLYKDGDCVLPMGIRGYNYTKKKYKLLSDEVVILRDDVRFENIIDSLLLIINHYLNNDFDKVEIIYNHYVNTLTQTPMTRTLLPIKLEEKEGIDLTSHHYDFDGGIDNILDKVLPIYIENIVYGLILDSKASEHASRMTAMKSATDNATEIIEALQLMFNRARQQAITLELTDIIGGANAASN